MGNGGMVLLIGLVPAAFAWWATYKILGGQFLARSPFLPKTWSAVWRSFVAGAVALGFFVLAGSLARGS